MANDQDPIAAIVAYLKTQSNVTDQTSTRIFGQELPRTELGNMPRKCLVITSAGGSFGHIETTTYREVRVDVRAYGETPKGAMDTHIATDTTLVGIQGVEQADTYLYSAVLETGAVALRDPDTDFPFIQAPYLLRYNTSDLNP